MIDTKCLEALLAEVTAAIDPAEDELRGLQKYLLLPLKPETASEVQALLARYQRRVGLMRTLAHVLSNTLACAKSVLEDGYPGLPVSEVSREGDEDLGEHLALMTRLGRPPKNGDGSDTVSIAIGRKLGRDPVPRALNGD